MGTKSDLDRRGQITGRKEGLQRLLRTATVGTMLAFLSVGLQAIAQPTNDNKEDAAGAESSAKHEKRKHQKLAELYGAYKMHTYKSDSNGLIQFGDPPVEFLAEGTGGISRAATPIANCDLAGYNQSVLTRGLPPQVLSAAVNRDISTAATSLRLQNGWYFGGNVFPILHLGIGYMLSKDSWRYERLNNASYTTIPYIKGIEYANVVLAEYTLTKGSLEIVGKSGYGAASIKFLNGIEEYLADNDGSPITKIHGSVIPASVVLRYMKWKFVGPFARVDYSFSNAVGTRVRDRSIVIGVSLRGP
jgi:hypothetical protein